MQTFLRLSGLRLSITCLTSLCLMVSLVLSLSSPLLPKAHAETFAVVDTARILTESAPAKAGDAHMLRVQNILQKALNDLQAVYKGKESTPAAQKALREALKNSG